MRVRTTISGYIVTDQPDDDGEAIDAMFMAVLALKGKHHIVEVNFWEEATITTGD